jgi:hypothetical protein
MLVAAVLAPVGCTGGADCAMVDCAEPGVDVRWRGDVVPAGATVVVCVDDACATAADDTGTPGETSTSAPSTGNPTDVGATIERGPDGGRISFPSPPGDGAVRVSVEITPRTGSVQRRSIEARTGGCCRHLGLTLDDDGLQIAT